MDVSELLDKIKNYPGLRNFIEQFAPTPSLPEKLSTFTINPETNWGSELRKHEQDKPMYGTSKVSRVPSWGTGSRYEHQEFPKMLYMAKRMPNGQYSVNETDDNLFPDAKGEVHPGTAEKFQRDCQKVVHNEDEYLKARGQGWSDSLQGALDHQEKKAQEIGLLTAQRHYEDRNMSELAKVEADKHDADTFDHQPEVPSQHVSPKPAETKAKVDRSALMKEIWAKKKAKLNIPDSALSVADHSK